ncbi:MAG: hydroxymethylglutaryl-CoA reductase [Flavobacterium sp.]
MTTSKKTHYLKGFEGHIENCIGVTQIPLGLVKKLQVNGLNANGFYDIPLSTTEGALVASYSRGAKAITESGGAQVICVEENVQRCPVFKFKNVNHAYEFSKWIEGLFSEFEEITKQKSRFAKLKNFKTTLEGNLCYVTFNFSTGDASGQNMTTFCTESFCFYIIENSLINIENWYIDGNFSGDKKATHQSFIETRGKRVIADVVLPKDIVNNLLRTTPQNMVNYWIASISGSLQSGSIGANGHYANGLAALFIATGQDVACVAESAIGITRMQLTDENDLYVSVTLPNLMVGTVGGGTSLSSQKSNLEIMNCAGENKAKEFAEVATALLLAGEISITAAISGGHFVRAHQLFGRKK